MGEIVMTQLVSYLVTVLAGAAVGYVVKGGREMVSAARSIDELTVMVCRLCIYDDHFSLDEKIEAYKLYRSKGANSQTKHHMDDLLGEDADRYLENH